MVDLPIAVCAWRPATYTHRFLGPSVVAGEAAKIMAALAVMPPVSVLVDGTNEVWAGWALAAPLGITEATALLTALATRLGGDLAGLAVPSAWTLPLAGPVRNWREDKPAFIDIVTADPDRVYEPAALIPR